ncbi:hypothetical protein [Facklamia miroungae]|uniref:Uncharacterized protein n=1 Tax=Facklamia miroungae TaxID=120956 RepID=A0A1G7PGC9_9LACT|nr:hypothetical protein [Facklamia miroungae]NKZ28701.1 hypothetical protein [Facklamia miroungae]SDF85258.1 hypothetical protein SAMN05421791_101243 [Facklamia miroungae]
MNNKEYKSGRLTLKGMNPATEKSFMVTIQGLIENVTPEQVQVIKDQMDQLTINPTDTAQAIYAYNFV